MQLQPDETYARDPHDLAVQLKRAWIYYAKLSFNSFVSEQYIGDVRGWPCLTEINRESIIVLQGSRLW